MLRRGDEQQQHDQPPQEQQQPQAGGDGSSSSSANAAPELDLGPYQHVAVLGRGSFGLVVLAKDVRTGQLAAVKLLPRGELIKSFRIMVLREVLHHGSLHHPFIVGLREVFLTPRYLAIAMEYAAGGDLFHHLLRQCDGHRLEESDARWIFQQLIIGLQYCHERGVANRDLKLENLLLDRQCGPGGRPVLKICDFGYSKHELNSSAKTGVGTPIYMAPEIIYGSMKYDAKKADIWSCGVILFTMLFGRYPFDPEQRDYARHIVAGQYVMPEDVAVSQSVRDLLRRLLVVDANERLTLSQIMAHPWFETDLPKGALQMNEWYMQNAPILDPVVVLVDEIVNLAGREGQPTDRIYSCPFQPIPPPAHGGEAASGAGSSGGAGRGAGAN
ncbi:hypothetical protein N2152v2_010676 [Parachlorella kessleri]